MKSFLISFLAGFLAANSLHSFNAPPTDTEVVCAKPTTTSHVCTCGDENGDSSSNATPPLTPTLGTHPLGKEGFVWPSQALGLTPRTATERPYPTPAVSVVDLLASLHRNHVPLRGFLVNVGANDGCLAQRRECDEANEILPLRPNVALKSDTMRRRNQDLYQNVTFRGVLVDPSPLTWHQKIYARDSYRAFQTGLTTTNAVQIFQSASVPLEFDFLKYDTDSADCEVIRVILQAGYRPSIVMSEFNIVYPPPLLFNQMATPDGVFQWGARGPHYQQLGNQCSLAYMSRMMAQYGYTLIQVDWWDAFYVRDELVDAATGGAPRYDDLSWYLHGYVTNAPSPSDRVKFLKKTSYTATVSKNGVVEDWLSKIVQASKDGSEDPLDAAQQLAMRTDFWWLATKEGYVQAKDVNLAKDRSSCHEGCVSQPFTLE